MSVVPQSWHPTVQSYSIPTRIAAWDWLFQNTSQKLGQAFWSASVCLAVATSSTWPPVHILHMPINDSVWCGFLQVGVLHSMLQQHLNCISQPSSFHRSHHIMRGDSLYVICVWQTKKPIRQNPSETKTHATAKLSLLQFVKIHGLPWCHSAKVKIGQA